VAILFAAAFAYANLMGSPHPSHYRGKQRPVTITGSVLNLHPGTPTVMVARAKNNTGHRLVMHRLRLQVKDASESCPRTLLHTKALRRRNALPPRRTRTVPVSILLAEGAPDACQSALFPIKFKARARRAGH
jgi:hypothetical protein